MANSSERELHYKGVSGGKQKGGRCIKHASRVRARVRSVVFLDGACMRAFTTRKVSNSGHEDYTATNVSLGCSQIVEHRVQPM